LWRWALSACPYARPHAARLVPPVLTQELPVPGGGRRGARNRLLAAARGLDDGRADPAGSGLLRFIRGRTRPVTLKRYEGRIAQRFRAPALHAGSRGFESLFAHWCIRSQREDCARENPATRG